MNRTRYWAILSELMGIHSAMRTVSGRQSVQLRISLLKMYQRGRS